MAKEYLSASSFYVDLIKNNNLPIRDKITFPKAVYAKPVGNNLLEYYTSPEEKSTGVDDFFWNQYTSERYALQARKQAINGDITHHIGANKRCTDAELIGNDACMDMSTGVSKCAEPNEAAKCSNLESGDKIVDLPKFCPQIEGESVPYPRQHFAASGMTPHTNGNQNNISCIYGVPNFYNPNVLPSSIYKTFNRTNFRTDNGEYDPLITTGKAELDKLHNTTVRNTLNYCLSNQDKLSPEHQVICDRVIKDVVENKNENTSAAGNGAEVDIINKQKADYNFMKEFCSNKATGAEGLSVGRYCADPENSICVTKLSGGQPVTTGLCDANIRKFCSTKIGPKATPAEFEKWKTTCGCMYQDAIIKDNKNPYQIAKDEFKKNVTSPAGIAMIDSMDPNCYYPLCVAAGTVKENKKGICDRPIELCIQNMNVEAGGNMTNVEAVNSCSFASNTDTKPDPKPTPDPKPDPKPTPTPTPTPEADNSKYMILAAIALVIIFMLLRQKNN
jgi:hypothetical protein